MSRPTSKHALRCRSPFSAAVHAAFAGSLAAAPLLGSPAAAQPASGPESTLLRFDIPAGDLSQALSAAAIRGGVQLAYDAELTRGKRTEGLSGDFTMREALARLLSGSGLELVPGPGSTYSLRALPLAAGEPAPVQLAPVTVTGAADQQGFKANTQESATKTPLSIRETPQSISAVTRDSMDTRLARDINTALELAAGAGAGPGGGGAFAGSGRWNAEYFSLRGQILDNARDVRTDGFAGGAPYIAPDLALFERIEVIKGPSAALYGTGSLSGFINRVTKKPQAERAASVKVQTGSFDTYRTEFDVTGALDAGSNYSARLIGVYEDSNSFMDRTDRQVKMIAPSLSAKLGDRDRLLVQGYFQDQGGTPSYGIPLLVGADGKLTAPGFRRSLYPGVGKADSDNQSTFVSTRLDHDLSDRWLASLALHHEKTRKHMHFDAYAYGIDATGESSLYTNLQRAETESWSGELRLDGAFSLFGNEHRLVAGVEKRKTERLDGNLYEGAGTANLYTEQFNATPADLTVPLELQGRLRTQAVYGQLILGLGPRTRLIGGLRYEEADVLAFGTERSERSDTTWRLGLSQDMPWGVTGFATYATTYVPVTALSATGEALPPETGDGLEFGLKGEWFDQRLGATLSIYRQQRDKVALNLRQNLCVAPGLTSCARSAGVQEFEGLELEINGRPWDGWTLGLAASWQDGEFTESSDPDFGQRALGLIERQTNLFLQYRFSGGTLNGLGLGATVVSVGERTSLAVGQYADGYERVDLNFSYDAIPRWNLQLLVRNLFDERYVEIVGAQAGYQNYFGSPTAALLRAEYRFKP